MSRKAAIIVLDGRGEVDAFTSELYQASLLDTLASIRTLRADPLVYTSRNAEAVALGDLTESVSVRRWTGGTPGSGLLNVVVETFGRGYERVVVLGSGTPTLPVEFVELALETLIEPYQVVLGPTPDDGIYLLGMNELYPAVLAGVDVCVPGHLSRILGQASETDAQLTILPAWSSISTPEGRAQLRAEPSGAAPRTTAVLATREDF